MGLLKQVLGKDGIMTKVTGLADKAIVDKDKRNEFIHSLSIIMMQSNVAKYVRAVLGVMVAVSCLFFADKLTIDKETQKYLLYLVFGFYFLDYLKGMIPKK